MKLACVREKPLTWDDLQTRDDAYARVLAELRIAAAETRDLLVIGEAGTGKLSVCHAIHLVSPRARAAFVVLRPGSTPAQVEAAIELARGGTLVVREPHLFSFQDRQRLGLAADLRMLITTTRTLTEVDCTSSVFDQLRRSLRMQAAQIPPLRQRPADVLPLFDSFTRELAADLGLAYEGRSDDLTRALLAHTWPRNLHELREAALDAVLDRARVAARGPASSAWNSSPTQDDLLTLEEAKRRYIAHAVVACGGNLAETARRLHVSETTVAKYARADKA